MTVSNMQERRKEWLDLLSEGSYPPAPEQSLLKEGFRQIDESDGMTVGTRVRLRNEVYPEAIHGGTGFIVWIGRKEGSWERLYKRENIEVVVRMDNGRLATVADYHLVKV